MRQPSSSPVRPLPQLPQAPSSPRHRLLSWAAVLVLALHLGGAALAAQSEAEALEPVRIRISLSGRLHHEAQVSITFPADAPRPLLLRMARSSPGRYRLHEFARNVYSLRARDASGRELDAVRTDPSGWSIAGAQGAVTVSYTVYGDMISGTYSAIDATHAKLNPPSVFAFALGLEERPVELAIESPDPAWKVATQLERHSNGAFFAPNLQYFFDSPIEVSDHKLYEWQAGAEGNQATIRMAFHHLGSAEDERAYVEETQRIVEETAAVFGELPRFDGGTYTFMADYLPWATGDAMEHRNSTPLSAPQSLAEAAEDHLETLVHEFFHAWNVERLRPATLEPFDFSRINMSAELWFAEGLTNYYDGLLLARTGAWPRERFVADLGHTIDRLLRSPASRYGSPRDMAEHAAFRDRGAWRDPQNAHNTYLHYYFYGDAVAAALDLALRGQHDSSLDELMRSLWQSHGRSESPYVEADLEVALADLTTPRFARDFFDSYVRGRGTPDYALLVQPFGYELAPSQPERAWLGEVELDVTADGARLEGGTTVDTPFYRAGLTRGDVILELGGSTISSPEAWAAALAALSPGDTVQARVRRRTGEEMVSLYVLADPTVELREVAGATAETLTRRERWLGSQR